ncbi:D-lactate dehydrogenase [Microbacterium immunditiarum]|uniref:D-lactate dehydrogenase n=1 Tax=Microbacterium immunditiarum TaxID=337480 RepID=A0A7Y9GKM5_9MICO|nr:D-lactate dehydrogenase [Microbacterium immunditiarum]
MVANNSSGMACGTVENAYRTLESMVFVLPSGTVVDTSSPDADDQLWAEEPRLAKGLLRLQRRVSENPGSRAIVERQFAMKNTIGYGINAFLDFAGPSDLLQHLIIGSEGTLAFVAEVTFRTVPLSPHLATSLAVFSSLDDAARAVPALVSTGAATLELMDAASIRVGQSLSGPPDEIVGFKATTQAALLVEYRTADPAHLLDLSADAERVFNQLDTLAPVAISTDPSMRARAWGFRKGLYASVAGARPVGTTALLEDIVVPVSSLADACRGLDVLFGEHGYNDSVIFGHAKDGNLHFMIADRFEGDEAIGRLDRFTDGLVDLVLDAGGNLKAEHGTGRAMAPFVRRQYGDELYQVMCELKRLCDPAGVLNPGVIISDDPQAHIRGIKTVVPIEEEVDRCVECGYCEPVCPSRDLTLTPRQRIVVRRAISQARLAGDTALASTLSTDYRYSGIDTCAVDGMCKTTCPVGIDTGQLVKRLRREDQRTSVAAVWKAAATAWAPATRTGAAALTAARVVPNRLLNVATDAARSILGADNFPEYSSDLPSGGSSRRRLRGVQGSANSTPIAIYVPACVNSMFGPVRGGIGATSAFIQLAERAGVSVIVPDGIESLCCGTPWTSKGYTDGAAVMSRRVRDAMRESSMDGYLRIVCDASSCTEGLKRTLMTADAEYRVEDAVEFVARDVLPRLGPVPPLVEKLVMHPTCSSLQMGLDGPLSNIAHAVASEVTIPDAWGCCGFAGDRGMLHPELTSAASAAEAAEVSELSATQGTTAYASCNRTCEIGMTRATGRDYRHLLELLEQATRPPEK